METKKNDEVLFFVEGGPRSFCSRFLKVIFFCALSRARRHQISFSLSPSLDFFFSLFDQRPFASSNTVTMASSSSPSAPSEQHPPMIYRRLGRTGLKVAWTTNVFCFERENEIKLTKKSLCRRRRQKGGDVFFFLFFLRSQLFVARPRLQTSVG